MKKNHVHVPEPSSKFLKLRCAECDEIQVVYSHATTAVTCNSCGNEITESSGSAAKLNGEIAGSAE